MGFVEFFQNIKVVVTVVHVIAIVIGMGAALSSDVLFTFFSRDKVLNETEISTLSVLAKVVLYGLVVIILSGIALFLSNIERYSHATKFQAKITILLILLINGFFLNKYVWPHLLEKGFFSLDKERNTRRLSFACGAISVISWIAVCALGVLDSLQMSYIAIMLVYLLIILCGIFASLVIEKRELN